MREENRATHVAHSSASRIEFSLRSLAQVAPRAGAGDCKRLSLKKSPPKP